MKPSLIIPGLRHAPAEFKRAVVIFNDGELAIQLVFWSDEGTSFSSIPRSIFWSDAGPEEFLRAFPVNEDFLQQNAWRRDYIDKGIAAITRSQPSSGVTCKMTPVTCGASGADIRFP